MAHICIIEDDPLFATALQRIMAFEHDVVLFSSVPDNAEEILASKPDLIFLDCMLPGETGPQFLQRLRGDERTRDVSVILMSAHYEMMEEVKRLECEYQEFLKKPCTMRQVMAAVQRHLKRAATSR